MKLKKINESFAPMTKEDHGEANPVYADAIRHMEKTDKEKQEATKLAETPKTETPEVVKTDDLKKMKLSESLFEDYDDEFGNEDYYTDHLYLLYDDNESTLEDGTQLEIESKFEELNGMSDRELLDKGIIAVAHIYDTDENGSDIIDRRIVPGNEERFKADIQTYLDNYESLTEDKKYKNLGSRVYNDLLDAGFKDNRIFPLRWNDRFESGYRAQTKRQERIDRAEQIANKYGLSYFVEKPDDLGIIEIKIEVPYDED